MKPPMTSSDQRALQAYFNYALSGILETDSDGTVERVNPAAASILGIEVKQLLGRTLDQLTSGAGQRRMARHLATLREQGISETTWLMPGRHGSDLVLELASVQIDAGRFLHVFDDVSDRQDAMLAAQLAHRAADDALQAKNAFLSNVSHEMLTPLNAIIGLSQLLSQDGLPPEQRGHIAAIERAGQALLAMVSDVLDGASLSTEHIQAQRVPVELHAVLGALEPLCRQALRDKALPVTITIAPDVPSMCLGDPLLLGQCLRNLLGNAIKFTAAGQVELRVSRRITDGSPQLLLAVSDTGIGIAPATLRQLFAPFTQGDPSSSRLFGGVGLGLYITRALAQRMGGSLHATSVPGRGSCFTLALPLASAGAGPDAFASAVAPLPVPQEFAGSRLLVAEDNVVNQIVIGQWLKRAGIVASFAGDGKSALEEVARNGAPQLILMDVQMPGLDGLDATRLLRARGFNQPIIGLSAGVSAAEQQACLDAGMNDFLGKPLDVDELWGCLTRWLAPQERRAARRPAPGSGAEPDVADAVRAAFASSHGADAAALQASLDAGERHTMARLVHGLKGAAGTVGAGAVAASSRAIEAALRDAAGDGRLQALLDELAGELGAFLGNKKQG